MKIKDWLKRLFSTNKSQSVASDSRAHPVTSHPAKTSTVAGSRAEPKAPNTNAAAARISLIVAVASGKGGVGKSTVTSLMAHACQQLGMRVGVLDADIYGPSQPTMLGSRQQAIVKQGLIQPVCHDGIAFVSMSSVTGRSSAVVVRAPIVVKTLQQLMYQVAWGERDILFIDMPPGTGDVQLSVAQKIALDGAIVVTTPESLAVEIADKSVEMFERVNVPVIGVIENMSYYQCQHCQTPQAIFGKGGGKRLAERHHIDLLAQLPLMPGMLQVADDKGLTWQSDTALSKIVVAAAKRMQLLLDELKQQGNDIEPSELLIAENQSAVILTWRDGRRIEMPAYQLRLNCRCALCCDEHSGERLLDDRSVDTNIRLLAVKSVGRYGFGARFSDGHTTGIYRYRHVYPT